MNKNSLIQQIFSLNIGIYINKGLIFIFLIVLPSILSFDLYGEFILFISSLTILSLIIGVCFESKIMLDIVNDENEKIKKLNVLILFIVILFIISSLLLYVLSFFIDFLSRDYMFLLISISSLILVLYNLLLTIFRTKKYYKNFFLLNILQVLFLYLIFIIIYLSNKEMISLNYLSIIYMVSFLIPTLYYMFKLEYNFLERLDFIYLIKSLKYSFPLVLHALSASLITQADKIIIASILNVQSLGIYAFAYNISQFIIMVIDAINKAWTPFGMKLLKKSLNKYKDEVVEKYISKLSILTFIILLLYILFIFLLTEMNYIKKLDITLFILISTALFFLGLYRFKSIYLFYNSHTKYLAKQGIVLGFFNLISNVILINILGLVGSSISMLLTMILYYILVVLQIRKYNAK